MLKCGISIVDLEEKDFSCNNCKTCTPTSKLVYPFDRDLFNSRGLVNELKKYIHEKTGCFCKDTDIDKNPDIDVFVDSEMKNLICRVEAKYLEGKAFVKSKQYIGIQAKETLVVDKPKLLSYFKCKSDDRKKNKEIPIFVVWKFDRPCEDIGGITIFQEIDKLKEIYDTCGSKREFERKSTQSDMVGTQKRGITEKYHFSIRECRPIEEIVNEIIKLK